MKHFLTVFLGFCSLTVSSQNLLIDTLLIPNLSWFEQLKTSPLRYPLFRSGNSVLDSTLNQAVKNQFTNDEFIGAPVDSSLIKWAGDGLIYLDFEVSFNRKNTLSFSVSAESCGAYCTGWTNYFNYSTITGTRISLDSIIALDENLKNQIVDDFEAQYQLRKTELKELLEEDGVLDSNSYDIALEYYQECREEFNFDTFRLFESSFEVKVDCYVPHMMRNLTPYFELNYTYSGQKIN